MQQWKYRVKSSTITFAGSRVFLVEILCYRYATTRHKAERSNRLELYLYTLCQSKDSFCILSNLFEYPFIIAEPGPLVIIRALKKPLASAMPMLFDFSRKRVFDPL